MNFGFCFWILICKMSCYVLHWHQVILGACWSFERLDLSNKTLLRRLDLVFTYCNSPYFFFYELELFHWHASPCICDWQATKLSNSCSGSMDALGRFAQGLLSVLEISVSKCHRETCETKVLTNKIICSLSHTLIPIN